MFTVWSCFEILSRGWILCSAESPSLKVDANNVIPPKSPWHPSLWFYNNLCKNPKYNRLCMIWFVMYQDDWCFSENRYPLNLLAQQHFPGFINDENFDFHSPFATSIIIFTNQLITMTPAPFCHHAIPSYNHLDFCSKKFLPGFLQTANISAIFLFLVISNTSERP